VTADWIPTAIAVVVFLGAATVYLRGSKDKGTIATLTASNAALTERVAVLETDALAKATQIDALTTANHVLTNTVNSSAQIAELQADLDRHHDAAMVGLEQIHSDLAGLPGKFATVMKPRP
jgi:hypothetical protein